MIVFSENRYFTLRKYVSGYRGQQETFSDLKFHTMDSFNYFRVKSRDTKLLIRSMWPVFRGAPGLQPFGQSYIYPDSLFCTFADYHKSYYVNDWNRPLAVNEILPILPDATYPDDAPMILTLANVRFFYDKLNIKDIYDGADADFSLYMDVEVAQ